jgi:CubicO group peptidase (beta-lactamase class C family)
MKLLRKKSNTGKLRTPISGLRSVWTMKTRLQSMFFLLVVCRLTVVGQSSAGDKHVLDKILQRAEQTHSSSMLVIKDGKTVVEYYAGDRNEKIQLMSCTKSIVSLAIGKLLDDSKIKSLDQPVHEFFPEWKQGKKALVTIKHLLNHTSGLQNVANAGIEVESSRDIVKLALEAELSDEPGARFSYNNKAVNLLVGIVERVSSKRLDAYFRDEFFEPLRIKDFAWTKDAAGNPYAHFGLQLSATDFARFGALILNRGKWNGAQLVSEKWIDAMLAQSQPFDESSGLLWWRTSSDETYTIDEEHLQTLEKVGVERSFLEKLQPLKGKSFKAGERTTAVANILGTNWQKIVSSQQLGNKNTTLFKKKLGEVDGYYANGYLGQFLVIVPRSNTVAVRQVKQSKVYNSNTDGFDDFISLVMQLKL